MKYMIIGAGGIGGIIGAFLAAGGKDAAIVARGEHLDAIRQNGLVAHTKLKGDICADCLKAYAPDDEFEKSDVIFVCVKGYSLEEIAPLIAKASHDKTVIIPMLNTINAADRIEKALPGSKNVLGGCIYTSSFVSAPGVITQPTPVFRIVFGTRKGHPAEQGLTEGIAKDLTDCGITAEVSPNIERDIFKKFAFISAFAATDSFFDVEIGELQKDGETRDMFIALLHELKAVCDAKGLEMDTDIIADSVKLLDGFNPSVTSSMHKDIKDGKRFEKNELIFDVVDLAKSLGVDVPQYRKIALNFGYNE